MAVDSEADGQPVQPNMEVIRRMNFEEKQRAINSCRTIVEDIATEQSDLNINDISRQLDKKMPDGTPVLGVLH